MKKTILSILMLFMVTSLFAGESDNQKEIEKLKAEISLLSRQLQSMTNQLEKLEKDVKEAPSSQQKSVYQNQNPDISVTGTFRYMGTDDKKDIRRNSLKLDGSELNFSKAVSPYTRGNVTIGFHDDEAHVEEAYADLAYSLPWNLNLRVGRFLVNTGYINSIHSHDWPFAVMPFPNEYFYGGGHGYGDDGIMISKHLDIDDQTYGQISVNALNGNNTLMFNNGQTKVFGGRVLFNRYFNDFDDDIQIGLNYNQGAHDAKGDLRADIYGVDAMYRHRINQFDKITLLGEYIKSSREQLAPSNLDAYGYYVAGIYKFKRTYNWHIGLEYDYSEKPANNTDATRAKSIFAGWWFTENDRLQLQFRKLEDPFKGRDSNEIWLQFIWGMGPHKPHLANF